MKRRLVLLLLLLVGGAIVNIAVAWACITLSSMDSDYVDSTDDENRYWQTHPALEGIPGIHFSRIAIMRGHGVAQLLNMVLWTDHEGSDMFSVVGAMGRSSAGWPCLALDGMAEDLTKPAWHREWIVESPWKPVEFIVHRDGWRDLPLKPLWPGFAINTVFYALILWLLFAGPFVVRRLRGGRRIRRGLCPKCAYDLRGTQANICPECGAAVKLDVAAM